MKHETALIKVCPFLTGSEHQVFGRVSSTDVKINECVGGECMMWREIPRMPSAFLDDSPKYPDGECGLKQ